MICVFLLTVAKCKVTLQFLHYDTITFQKITFLLFSQQNNYSRQILVVNNNISEGLNKFWVNLWGFNVFKMSKLLISYISNKMSKLLINYISNKI
jgi:hypothetical protein